MAEEFVRKEHFDEYTVRPEKRLAFQNRIMLGLLSMLLAGLVKYLFFQ